jgi:hypothetical protein
MGSHSGGYEYFCLLEYNASSLVHYQHWAGLGIHRKHSLIYCCMLDRVYRAVAWQRVNQIPYIFIIFFTTYKTSVQL